MGVVRLRTKLRLASTCLTPPWRATVCEVRPNCQAPPCHVPHRLPVWLGERSGFAHSATREVFLVYQTLREAPWRRKNH